MKSIKINSGLFRLQTYNDIPCVVDKGAESFLADNGVDPALAYHVAHLFAR